MENIILEKKSELQAAALDAGCLTLHVAIEVPESDLRVIGILNKFSIKNNSGDERKLDECKVKVNISGFKATLPGDHPIIFLDGKPVPAVR